MFTHLKKEFLISTQHVKCKICSKSVLCFCHSSWRVSVTQNGGCLSSSAKNRVIVLLYPYTYALVKFKYLTLCISVGSVMDMWTACSQNYVCIDLRVTVNLCIMSWLESQNNVDCWWLTGHSLSACLCVVKLYFLVLSIVRLNLNDEQKHWRLNLMENVATGLVFMIVVVNVFITAFGVHTPNRGDWPRTRTGILSIFANLMYSLCSPSFSAPLSLYKHVFLSLA